MPLTFLDPGALRTELDLEQPVRTVDALGGADVGWMPIATLFGLVEPESAMQAFRAARDDERMLWRITIRARGGVESGMRLRGGSRAYLISTVSDADGTGRYLVCRAEEVTP